LISSTLTYLAGNKKVQEQLRAELNKLDKEALSSPDKCMQALKSSKYLNNFFLESLRYHAPVAPLVRYASKATQINDIKIPARTFIMAPIRRMLHDPNRYENPEIFDPFRHEDPSKDPTFIFSKGSRACPASYGFSKTIFLMAIKMFFMDNEMTLIGEHQKLEPLDLTSKEPLLERQYFAQLRNIKDSAEVKSLTTQFDMGQSRAGELISANEAVLEPQGKALTARKQSLGLH
jgi:hypothetical protein